MLFRQALSLLLVSSASAFVTSPFGGFRALPPQKVLQNQQQLLSEPNGVTESSVPVDEPAVQVVTEHVVDDEPAVAVAEISSEGGVINEESSAAEGSGSVVEKKSTKPPSKDDKDRFTAFVGNLPFSKLN
jgi:hypothetical protein